MTFGERLQALRAEKGWSIEELSERSGVDKEQLSRLENNKHKAQVRTRKKLADALGLTFEQFQAATSRAKNDDNAGDIAHKITGVTGEAASGSGMTVPVKRPAQTSGGRQEVPRMDKPTMIYNMVCDLPKARQDAWYRAIAADIASRGRAAPQPAARGEVLQRQRK
jgi:transcriptional regulator with XRE-family HTH domain